MTIIINQTISKIIIILIFCTSLIASQLGYCDTLIFKSGRQISGSQAWTEGNQIKIIKFGEVIGFNKNKVAEIKRTEPSIKNNVSSTVTRQPYPVSANNYVATHKENNPVAKINRSKVITDVKAKLSERYSGNYHLQKILLDGNMEAYEYLKRLPSTNVNVQVLSNLLKKYYPSFHLIKILYDGNIKAYRQLNR